MRLTREPYSLIFSASRGLASGALALTLLLGCGTRQAPPPRVGLPERAVLGGGASPLGTFPSAAFGQAPTVQDPWYSAIESLAHELSNQLRWDGQKRMRVAVLDFVESHGRDCSLGAPAAEDLTTSLFATPRFELIERRMLNRVLMENNATQSDLYDPSHAARLGGLLGADGVVTGTVTASRDDYAFNIRVILTETGGVASAARSVLLRKDADGRGTCGDGRVVIAAPPP